MIKKTPLAAAALLASALGVSAYAWLGSEQSGGGHLDDATHADGEHHGTAAPTRHAEASNHGDGEHHDAKPEDADDEGLHLSPAQIEAAGIRVVSAGPQALDEAFSLPGEIGFDEDRTAHVVPRTPGMVESVAVELGQSVKKGDLLAVIASQQVSELRSELAAAQRRLALASTTFERERELWREKISAEQDYLQARQSLEEAQIALANARQKTNALSGVSASAGGNRYELRAPFDGVVVEKHLVPGEMVSEASAAFTLSDLSRVWASFSVAPQDLARVQVGKAARVEAPDLGMQVEGRVAYVGSLLGEQTRSAVARVTLANPDGAWRPGLFVNVRVRSAAREVPVAVPEQAVQEVEGKPSVFVRNAEGFAPRPVSLGVRSAGQVEVLAGLDAGDQVAGEGSFILKSELGKSSASHAH
ncbi:efflux RND transporter periplasmic adaptor subunit [Pseudomonas sp. PDNC002]|uniref:efflux RND transporter periplasmic adaptor subunit n=1 Tax=Pseudomonas sp. PDNC002 TaxID=2811422 RepID=UPI001962E266|nr:efflux RND transporter periplasmic adaptor subunit [Pseudomonas sp. PDNC002]QRY77312.1 efflux RND transporter periplasmic adaptor subunit [Pseudomonas sp. PDNC002]